MPMITVKHIEESFDPDVYNALATHPLQTWEWGEARKEMGLLVERFGLYEKNKLTSVYQMTIHKIGLGSFTLGYLPRSNMPSPEVLSYLYDVGKKHNIIFVKIEPYVSNNQQYHVSNFKLTRSSHPLFPPWTQILDLTSSEENILSQMKSKTRYNIRLAEKKGVQVREMSNQEGFDIFQKLYFDTCARQKYFGHTKKYHNIVWNHLKKNIAHILVAFYKNIPLATYELFFFKDTLYYPYGGTSEELRNVMAANLLMWEAIKLGKQLGAKKFDMWGSLSPVYDIQHPWAGFTRFKEGYGASFVQMQHSHDLVINPLYYALYNQIYKLRSFFLQLL